MGYITYAEINGWNAISDYSQTEVEEMIEWASDMVNELTHTNFSSTDATTKTDVFYGDGYNKRFILRKRPLISISKAWVYDGDGDTTSVTMDHTIDDAGVIVLDTACTTSYRLEVTYSYGDTDRIGLAKLLTHYLTRLGLMFMDPNLGSGVYPSVSVSLGEISYSLRASAEAQSLLMNVQQILDTLRKHNFRAIGRSGYYDYLK